MGWRRGRAAPTASGPSTSTAMRTERSAPPTRAKEASSWATSARSRSGEAASSREAEVDHPRPAVGADEDVGPPQVAVGDAVLLERGDLLPRRPHELVGHLVVGERVQRSTVDGVVGEQHRVGADVDHRPHPRRADAHVPGVQRDEGLVLDRAPQVRERPLVAHVAEAQEPPQPEEQVRGPLVRAEHLHEQRTAVDGAGQVRGAPHERRPTPAPARPPPGRRRPGPPRARRGSGGATADRGRAAPRIRPSPPGRRRGTPRPAARPTRRCAAPPPPPATPRRRVATAAPRTGRGPRRRPPPAPAPARSRWTRSRARPARRGR